LDEDWGQMVYPFIAGHEIVGEVTAVGSKVTTLTVGQLVGVGWQKSCCGNCDECQAGNTKFCQLSETTCGIGGLAEFHRTKAKFAFDLSMFKDYPDKLAGVSALLCAGVTTWSPFDEHGVRAYDRVGIIGCGGLGHLAIQWAKAWGCEVVAFSTSASKEEDCKRLGAHKFVQYGGKKDDPINKKVTSKYEGYFNFILVTHPYPVDSGWLVSLLKRDGKLCYVANASNVNVPPSELFMTARRSIVGTNTGTIAQHKLMLEFAARHQIYPWIEKMPVEKVNEAIKVVKDNKMRYRIVLSFESMGKK